MESHSYYRIICLNRFVHCDQSMMEQLVSEFVESIHMGIYQKDKIEFRTIVVQNVGYLSNVTQASMRRLIEKVHMICRFIFCTSNISAVIDPLQSRCVVLRLPRISDEEQQKIICEERSLENVELVADNISENTLLSKLHDLNGTYPELPWNTILNNIITWCCDPKSNMTLDKMIENRQNMYCIMRYNITGTYIFKYFMEYIVKNDTDLERVHQVLQLIADLEHKLITGNKDIFYLEAFIIKTYQIYH